MRIRRIIFTSLLIVLFACIPAFANINLEFNDQECKYDDGGYLLDNGITFVETKLIDTYIGASVYVDESDILLAKGDDKLKLTLDQLNAQLNDELLTLVAAPYRTDSSIMLPLRSVAEALGAQVIWHSDSRTVSVNYHETKGDFTAEELIAKTNQIINELPSYDMDGNMGMQITMSGIDEEGFPIDMNMDSTFYAHYEKDPITLYTKQIMKMEQIPDMSEGLEEMEVEALLLEDIYYINSPEIGWIKMDLGEFNFNELMDTFNNQDPAAMLKQMQDFGMTPTFGDDVEIDGQNYWVVDVTIDPEKFTNEYQKLMTSLPIPGVSEIEDEFRKIMDNLVFDINYTNYINHSTYLTDFMEINMLMKMSIPSPEENSSETLDLHMNIQGKFNVKNADPNFSLPDVSSAQDLQTQIN